MNRKKIWLGGIFLAMTALAIVWLHDPALPPGSDADLAYTRPEVPRSQNGFYSLDAAVAQLDWPQEFGKFCGKNFYDHFSLAPHENPKTPNETNPSPSAIITSILQRNTNVVPSLDQALSTTNLLVPEPQSPIDNFNYLPDWKKLAQFQLVRTLDFFRGGNEPEAFRAALRLVALGHSIQDSGGPMLHYLVGSAIKTMGLKSVQAMARQTRLSSADLREFWRQLDAFPANRTGFTNAMKNEYRFAMEMMKSMRSGSLGGTNSGLPPILPSAAKLFIKEGKCRILFSEKCRAILAASTLSYAGMVARNPPGKPPGKLDLAHMFLRGNPVGEILASQISWDNLQSKLPFDDVQLQGTRTVLALKCFQIDHNRLPNTLSELVPQYFPSVPEDAFDGKPLRFLADKKLLYSIGTDLKDSQGQEWDAKKNKLDIPFPLE